MLPAADSAGKQLPKGSEQALWYLLEGHVRATARTRTPECVREAQVLLGSRIKASCSTGMTLDGGRRMP